MRDDMLDCGDDVAWAHFLFNSGNITFTSIIPTYTYLPYNHTELMCTPVPSCDMASHYAEQIMISCTQ